MLVRDNIINSVADWHILLQNLDREVSKYIIICDTNTAMHCKSVFVSNYLKEHRHNLIEIDIRAGEENKTLSTAEQIWSKLQIDAVDRSSLIIALGGGLVTDVAGFAACTFKRGIRLINVPTTHLGMTDAALGGKNGLNFGGLKNQIGSLHYPEAVLIDPIFLKTLPKRELYSGWIETVKHSLIADASFWQTISCNPIEDLLFERDVILRSAQIKIDIAAVDQADLGIRQALNFGHTIGHALESQCDLLHGEAVAFGIIAELYLSMKLAGLDQKSVQSVLAYLRLYHSAFDAIEIDVSALLTAMRNDKKNSAGEVRFSLIPEIGRAKVGIAIEDKLIEEAIKFAKKEVRT